MKNTTRDQGKRGMQRTKACRCRAKRLLSNAAHCCETAPRFFHAAAPD